VEAPARVRAIWKELEQAGIARLVPPKSYPNRHILEVQDARLVSFMQRTCKLAGSEKSIYPYVFPVRNQTRPPKEQTVLAGYYCIDTFTPLNENAWLAARRAVDCTMTAADLLLDGEPCAYALVRPPGHHAESKVFGGFCYFANAAIAAQYLSHYGTVAILDIDYHHGNGQQDIFYERSDVLTVSIHGDPEFAYPYFSGFADEKGIGTGAGFNLNLTLPETITPERFHRTLATALKHIRQFQPDYLVLAAGFDTAKGDPTGTWSNLSKDFLEIGRAIGQQGFPTLVVQEGGYRVRSLGINVRQFFVGMSAGQKLAFAARSADSRQAKQKMGARLSARVNVGIERNQISDQDLARVSLRDAVRVGDTERIRSLVGATAVFSAEEITFAGELVEERLARGALSGYDFVLAEHRGRLLGYTCYGHIDGTEASFDLYWIAVDPDLQGRGLGRRLLQRAEKNMRDAGVKIVYVDTSSTDAYAPTRKFYESMGYVEDARLPDFYRPGDGKVIFCKRFDPST
jgi:acetoin utilization deacetylase AcuC-like enzyme/GNAT superfamily N-acetyltransferase